MRILGVDYGRAKIGLALADGPLAEPLATVAISDREDALAKIERIVKVESIDRVVVGVSEGKMGREQQEFAQSLKEKLPYVLVVSWDETLSTQDAQNLARQAGVGRKKRQDLEDAFAAAVVLQSFLDAAENPNSRRV